VNACKQPVNFLRAVHFEYLAAANFNRLAETIELDGDFKIIRKFLRRSWLSLIRFPGHDTVQRTAGLPKLSECTTRGTWALLGAETRAVRAILAPELSHRETKQTYVGMTMGRNSSPCSRIEEIWNGETKSELKFDFVLLGWEGQLQDFLPDF
jgi:hypothetical protein